MKLEKVRRKNDEIRFEAVRGKINIKKYDYASLK